jgi:hypothetical protein
LNVGLIFNQFNLSPSAEMYVFNEARTVMDSAIKKFHFSSSAKVSISSFVGSSIILYIFEPGNTGNVISSISINRVIAGFQDIFDVENTSSSLSFARASTNCNLSVQCDLSKEAYARSVGRMSSNGFSGTGTLINNEGNNGRAYFLTAFHVLDVNRNFLGKAVGNGILDPEELSALEGANFTFYFWREQCNGTAIRQAISFTGAVVRAESFYTDAVLLELTNPPGIGDLVNYSGWNRQTSAPANSLSFILHHPRSRDMRVTKTSSVNSWIWNPNYWSAYYSSGTVDKGSSGAALMNENGQIVGQLRSGWSNCNFTNFSDRYGKFDKSWNGGGFQTWLSPNQGLQSSNLLNLTNIPINGPGTIACTTPAQFSTLPNLLDVTYQWSVSAGLQIISGQGTPNVTISGFSSNNVSLGTLTLTLSSPTKGRTRVYTTSKQVFISSGTVLGTYNSPTSSNQPIASFTRFNQVTNNTCISASTNMTIPAGSSVVWSGPSNSSDIVWSQSGNNVNIYFSGLNQTIVLSLSVTNSCGTTILNYRFTCTNTAPCGIVPLRVLLSPNPANSIIQVSLVESAKSSNKVDIAEVRVVDKLGIIKIKTSLGLNKKEISLDVSGLASDVYTILLFDGRSWISEKFVKN